MFCKVAFLVVYFAACTAFWHEITSSITVQKIALEGSEQDNSDKFVLLSEQGRVINMQFFKLYRLLRRD